MMGRCHDRPCHDEPVSWWWLAPLTVAAAAVPALTVATRRLMREVTALAARADRLRQLGGAPPVEPAGRGGVQGPGRGPEPVSGHDDHH